MICHTLYQLVPVVAAGLHTVGWAVDQTLVLQKRITAGTNCAAEEFAKFYSEEQKLWLEDLFERRVNEVSGTAKKYYGIIPSTKRPKVE